MHLDNWVLIEYDRIVADAGGDAITPRDAKKLMAERYIEALESGLIARPEPNDYRDLDALFERVVRPERDRRREHIVDDIDYLLAAKDNQTFLGRDDPVFGQAHKLGTGKDKILGLWTAEDWQTASLTRYDVAAAITAAAALFREKARSIIEYMRRDNARVIWEMWGDEENGESS
jgi:hypothetical protein